MPSLQDAETWLYHLGDVSDKRAAEIGKTNADLVVTEWADYSGREAPYTPAQIETMRGGDDKLIVSYISIGEAEPYRYYWDESWETAAGRPGWIGEANPEWVDNIRVRYWDPEWQAVVFDYAERIVEQGFNGLYLDIVSAYEFWEKKDRAPGIDHRGEMAKFVAALKQVVDARVAEIDPGREFVIIGQNALELIKDKTYLDAIDGIAKEDLQFYYEYGRPQDFAPWPKSEYKYHLNLLKQAEAAGKATFVVEYVPDGKLGKASDKLKAEAADLGDNGTPIYIGATRDLTDIADQPGEIENGVFAPLGSGGSTTPGPDPDPEITGTARDDRLAGTAGDDTIDGLAGDDTIRARGGNDNVRGGDGHDEVFGGAGRDKVYGDAGLDELFGDAGRDFLFGGDGSDLIRGGGGRDKVNGGAGSDELFGNGGKDVLTGGAGGDLLTGGGGGDRFVFRKGSGEDEIADFDMARDRIDLANGATYSLDQLRKGLYLDLEGRDGVLLLGVQMADFDPDVIV